MDRIRSLEILGVSENASDEEIERRYSLLLKKYRAMEKKLQEDPAFVSDEPMVTIDELNEAYRIIKGIEKVEMAPVKVGWNKEWFAHFFHYYKVHVIVGIVILAIIGFSIKGAVDRQQIRAQEALLPKPDLEVLFVGNYASNEIPKIEEILLKQFPEWKRIKVDIIYRPLEGQVDPAYIQKSMLDLMTKKGDVYIMDKMNYDQLIEQELFEDPSTITGKEDLSKSPLWTDIPMMGSKDKLVSISKEVQHKENAIEFIEKLQPSK